jgi:hypothetical protein
MFLSDAQITELYSLGKSCADIAHIGECSETTIYNRLKSLGVTMRNRSEANQIFPDCIFILLYNLGLSASQIGTLLGLDSSTVIKRLHKLNFPLRSGALARNIRYTNDEFKTHFMTPKILDILGDM